MVMIPQAGNITELRQNLPGYMERVEAGESFLAPVRGKVVARLQPEIDQAEAAQQCLLSYGLLSNVFSAMVFSAMVFSAIYNVPLLSGDRKLAQVCCMLSASAVSYTRSTTRA